MPWIFFFCGWQHFLSQEPVHIRYKELLHVKEQLEKHVDELRKELAARQTHDSPRVASAIVWGSASLAGNTCQCLRQQVGRWGVWRVQSASTWGLSTTWARVVIVGSSGLQAGLAMCLQLCSTQCRCTLVCVMKRILLTNVNYDEIWVSCSRGEENRFITAISKLAGK